MLAVISSARALIPTSQHTATMLRSSSVPQRLARCSQRSAALHMGRATPEDTREFLTRSAAPAASSASLRVGKGGETLAVGARGVGSPALWAKDVPRVDASKAAMSSFSSNFLQTAINPFEPVRAGHKQSYVEALVLQELVEELNIPREAFVVSALLGDNLLSPAEQEPTERLAGAAIKRGVEIAMDELTAEVIDHVVCKVPDEILTSSKLLETLTRASDALEALRSNGQVQSYGFAFPGFSNGWASIDGIVEDTLIPLSEKFDGFASLQLPVHIGNLPLPRVLSQFRDEKSMLLIGDRPLESVLSNGKPLMFKTYAEKPGEDVALLLKTAFNLAISVEKTYIEKVAPSHPTLKLPAPQDVAWGHILANQHGQFDNLEEWIFVLESQIYPRFEVIVKELAQHEETKQFGFAYSMALRELFKCFTASIELADSSRVDSITDAWVASGIVEQGTLSVEEVAVKAVLSAGANVVLVQEQLPEDSSLSFSERFTPEQVQTLSTAAAPFLQAE